MSGGGLSHRVRLIRGTDHWPDRRTWHSAGREFPGRRPRELWLFGGFAASYDLLAGIERPISEADLHCRGDIGARYHLGLRAASGAWGGVCSLSLAGLR